MLFKTLIDGATERLLDVAEEYRGQGAKANNKADLSWRELTN